MSRTNTAIKFTVIILAMLAIAYVNLAVGSSSISMPDIYKILLHRSMDDAAYRIIWGIRIPRILAALILGGALSLSGYLLQTFFNNPIAGPFVLGISSGAKLVVAVVMIISLELGFSLSGIMVVAAAFLGAVISTAFVLITAGRVHNMSILIVCGIMIGYICSAITELIVSFADDSNIVNLHNWSMGSFSSISMGDVAIFGPIVLIAMVISVFMIKNISAYLYGENYAYSLGIDIRLFRLALITLSSILSATVAAYAGPVSFVGIAVPHIIRNIFRTNRPAIMIPASFIGGATFCLFCDLLARMLFAPTELSISTVTAILGAPVVISMLLRKREH